MKTTLISLAILLGSLALAQDKPQPIDKKDLPKTAVPIFCGVGKIETEKPEVGYQFKGKPYYFCEKTVGDAFLKDPEAFIPPVLPRPAPAWIRTG